MSGGHFDYKQHDIDDIADTIEAILRRKGCLNFTGQWGREDFYPRTIERFEIAIETLRRAAIMAHRIDWLLSGDDGEDTFAEIWDRDLDELQAKNK